MLALGVVRSKPSMVSINLTSRCNQKCIYCEIGTSHFSHEKDILTADDLRWVIDQMAVNKIRKISLCGGEPFLFEGIIDMVAYARTKNIRCSITSNGMTVPKLNDAELKILRECKTEINISVDSFNGNIQSYTRGTATALPNALKSLQKLKENLIPVTVLTVISKYNYYDLFESFKVAWEKGVLQVLFQPVIYSSNYPECHAVNNKSQLNVGVDDLEKLMDELKKILHFERRHNIKTNVYRILPWIEFYLKTVAAQKGQWFFNDVLRKFFCREIYAIIEIGYDGGIQACGLLPASVSVLNNRQKDLAELWSQATMEIKDDMRNGRFHKECNACCHHFSRNMLASVFKHPFQNGAALMTLIPLVFSRIQSGIIKKNNNHSI